MVKRFKNLGVVLTFVLPLVGVFACNSLVPALQKGVDTVKQVSSDADKTIASLEVQIKGLAPNDPIRVALEGKVAAVQKVKVQADTYIAGASAVLTTVQSGTLSPDAAGALALLPYGAYISGGLGLIIGAVNRAKANGSLADLENVVASWHAINPAMTDDQKAVVAATQGDKTSAVVDAIKDKLGLETPVAPVAAVVAPEVKAA